MKITTLIQNTNLKAGRPVCCVPTDALSLLSTQDGARGATRPTSLRRLVGRFSLLALSGVLLAARAETIEVTNTNDSGAGSLRQAILDANANPGADVIQFAAGLAGQISLTNGQLVITAGVTIEGPGANVLAVDAGHLSRVLQVQASGVTIRGLTLRNGRCPVGQVGGGILVIGSSSLTLEECAITGNTVPEPAGSVREGGGV
jgi:hypothetical protein